MSQIAIRLAGGTGNELLTPAQMYAADAQAIARGTPGKVLMENAGHAVFREMTLRWSRRPVTVLCGPGNNGGDGFVIARLLGEDGWPVTVALLGDAARLKGDAAWARDTWQGEISPLNADALQGTRLIVDAVFGAGLARDVDGELAHVVEQAAARCIPVVAVDVPSGIDGGTGEVRGCAFNAALTVTFCRLKPGHILLPGREHCGVTVCADIGVTAADLPASAADLQLNGPNIWSAHLRRPGARGHKYTRGHALIVSGGAFTSGAARLAASAALRSGAGLVTVASPPDAMPVNAAHLDAVMLRQASGARDIGAILSDRRFTAAAIGPGCGVSGSTRANARAVLASGAACVLDADALTSFAADPQDLADCIAELPHRPVVLTPHDGEFARLFRHLEPFPDSKYEKARTAAAASGAVIVLKGADTVIADPGGRCLINANAPPGLATAGAGDVLTGIITALLSQGVPARAAAAAGVWFHGAAATAADAGLTAEELPGLLPIALSSLQK
jgi:NAD(P)H-hydrate epimerase